MNLFSRLSQRVMVLVVLGMAAVAGTSAQNLTAKLPTDPNVITGKLPNGLTYYIRNNHKPEKKVELRLVVKAGSILENDDQQGLAHFMEHMNFNGTKNFQRNDLVSYLQSIGVQFGADLNANTGFDQTIYILPIPTDKPGNLEKGFQIIEDWAHNALLTGKDIDDERGVVLEESRLGKGAGMRMLDKYFPKLASGSLYAERLPIGKDSILKTFKYDKIRSFYHDWYRPDLQAVIIVGDIDVNTAKEMLMKHFAGLKNPENERPRNYVDVQPRTQPEAMVVTDREATNSILQIMFPFVKKPLQETFGDYRDYLKRELVMQMFNRRLTDLSQSATPPFAYAQVNFDGLIHGYESFGAFALLDDDPKKTISALTAELLKAKEYGFTNDELELAKKEMLSNVEKLYNERTTTDSKDYVDEYIRNFVDGESFPGIANEYDYTKEMLPTIKVEELNELPKQWMSNMNTFTLITGPDAKAADLPNDATLLAMANAGFQQQVQQEQDKAVASTLMTTIPTPGKMVSEKKEDGFGAVTYTLSNGVEVTIKPTTFKSDEIILKGLKKGGSNSYGVADRSNVHFATDLVDAMGVGNFTPNDLEKVMAGKNVKVTTNIDDIDDDVNGSCTVKDFESMLQLINLDLTQPRKDQDLFNAYKQKQVALLQFLSANPQVSFIDTTIKTLYNNNPLARMVFPKAADFDKLNLDRSLEIYHNELGTANGYHFFIVGNIKPEEALPLLETYLGSLPTSAQAAAYKDNGVRPIAGNHEMKYKKGTEKKSLIIEAYHGEMPYSEDLSLKAQALAEVLNIKVIEDLREKMSDIYTGGFYAQVEKEPYSRYTIALQLPCGPEHVDTLIAAANEEIEALKKNGPSMEDLEKVKSQWHEKHQTDIIDNSYWAGKMESVLFWGRDKDRVLNYQTWVNKLTPADIQETAKLLFNGKNRFVSVLYPAS